MRSSFLSVVVLIVCPLSLACGQDKSHNGPVGIFQSPDEYDNFMRNAKRAAYGENGSLEMQAMIPLLNDIVLNRPPGSTASQYGIEASTLGMLSDPNVRSELEMVEDQYSQLKQLNSEIQQRASRKLLNLDFSDSSSIMDQVRSIRERANDELNSVLLPHQLERLQQIRMQSQLRRRSLVDVLTSDPIKSRLEITDDQSDELRQSEREIQQELARKIAKLQEEARDRLLSKLKPSQKDAARKMIGDAFEFTNRAKSKPEK